MGDHRRTTIGFFLEGFTLCAQEPEVIEGNLRALSVSLKLLHDVRQRLSSHRQTGFQSIPSCVLRAFPPEFPNGFLHEVPKQLALLDT